MYRIIKSYWPDYGRDGYLLVKRYRFLFWTFDETVAYDPYGHKYESWMKHYGIKEVETSH